MKNKNGIFFLKRRAQNLALCFFTMLIFLATQKSFAQDLEEVVNEQDSINVVEEATVETESLYTFKNKYEEDYLIGAEVNQRNVPDSVIQRIKNEDDFWYHHGAVLKKEKEDTDKSGSFFSFLWKDWFRTLMWIIVLGCFAVALISFLVSSKVFIFTSPSTAIMQNMEQEAGNNMFEFDFPVGIQKAIDGGNFRLAIRLMYLFSLRKLAERKIIQFKKEKTNFDYLMQLSGTAYYDNFFRITRDYEFVWYGQFEVDAEKFSKIKSDFDQFYKKLNG